MNANQTEQLKLHILSTDTGYKAAQAIKLLTGLQPFDVNSCNTQLRDRKISLEDQEYWKELALVYGQSDKQQNFWETLAPSELNIEKNDLSIWETLENLLEEISIKKFHDPQFTEELNKIKSWTNLAHVFPLPNGITKNESIEFLREYTKSHFVKNGQVATYVLLWNYERSYAYIQVSFKVINEEDKSLTNLLFQNVLDTAAR